jgi:hypothetical protein
MKNYLAFLFPALLTSGAMAQNNYPVRNITNNLIKAELPLPDLNKGYYQGTRFDWSGIVNKLEYNGHQYFGQWVKKHDPKLHEAVCGPAEAFVPIGFEEVNAGNHFLVIGVGMLVKPDNSSYKFSTTYDISDPGKWNVKYNRNSIEFTHELKAKEGYSYIYTKKVTLLKNKPVMVIEHRLKNRGEKTLETNTYNHNFFIIDQEPTGPAIVTSFPFKIKAEGQNFGKLIVARDSSLIYPRQLEDGEIVFSPGIQRLDTGQNDYQIRIENVKTGAGVLIKCDRPYKEIKYWACQATACPEPYLSLKVHPQDEYRWTLSYCFYTNN